MIGPEASPPPRSGEVPGAPNAANETLRPSRAAKAGAWILIGLGFSIWAPSVAARVLRPTVFGDDLLGSVLLNLTDMTGGLVLGGLPILAGIAALRRQRFGQFVGAILALLLALFSGLGACWFLFVATYDPFDPTLLIYLLAAITSFVLLRRAFRRHEV